MASLAAFSMADTNRSHPMGQAPARVWYKKYSVLASGKPSRRKRAFMRVQRRTAATQRCGISDSNPILSRVSSPRLVSWVALASMVCGHSD